jgi:hypothetical protein
MTRETSVADATLAFAFSRRRGVRARACVVDDARGRHALDRGGGCRV